MNTPDLDGKYLGSITKDFVIVADSLKEASYQVRTQRFSDYPIFPICQTESPIGLLLINKEEAALQWNFYSTYLNEFLARKLITSDKVELFKENYKDPDEFCCLFIIDGDLKSFVYVPYPED